jgi:prevent-host-death family protein
MLTKMTVREARDNFSDLLGSVYYGGKPVAVVKKGRIFAIVVNPDEYQALRKAAKASFFKMVDDMQKKNKGKDADRVVRDVTKEVEKVRSRRYEENG